MIRTLFVALRMATKYCISNKATLGVTTSLALLSLLIWRQTNIASTILGLPVKLNQSLGLLNKFISSSAYNTLKHRSTTTVATVTDNVSHSWCHQQLLLYLPKPGLIELAQYNVALSNMTRSAMQFTSDNFDDIKSTISYNVTSLVQEDCVAFFVHENRRRQQLRHREAVRGGSGFHTVVTGQNTIDFCPYVDHGNDTYTIFCPLYEPCVDVMSHLIYFDYLAFWPVLEFNHRPANVLVVKQRVCNESSTFRSFPQLNYRPYWLRVNKSRSNLATKSNASSSLARDFSDNDFTTSVSWKLHQNGHKIPPIGKTEFERCKTKTQLSSLVFIGDSHIRLTSNYALDVDTSSPRIVSSFQKVYIDEFQTEFRKIVQRIQTAGKPAAIIANLGLHGICKVNLTRFSELTLPRLIQLLQQLQENGLLNNTKLIIVDLVGKLPASDNFQRTANSVVITAVNRLLGDAIATARLNVTFVEYFEMARVLLNKTAYSHDHHYINVFRVKNKKDAVTYGDVGKEIANYLFNLVCL